jgi:hypothetical protein
MEKIFLTIMLIAICLIVIPIVVLTWVMMYDAVKEFLNNRKDV